MSINAMSTVRELAVNVPGATGIFEQMGIDYCCGGGRTLADACQNFHVELDAVMRSLQNVAQHIPAETKTVLWQNESLDALLTHIMSQHHVYTRTALDRLEKLMDKVLNHHGPNHRELARLSELFLMLRDDLFPHMLKEEQVLFPYITRMEEAVANRQAFQPPFFGTVQNPVRMMMSEHDAAGDLLREMRQLTSGFVTPPDGCMSFQALYSGLHELEADLHQHIHLENNVLFPRAVELEKQTNPGWQTAAKSQTHQCFGG